MDVIPFILVMVFIAAPGIIFLVSKLGSPDTYQRKKTDAPHGMHVNRSSIKEWEER